MVESTPAVPAGSDKPACNIIACAVFVNGQLLGAFSVGMTGRADSQQRAVLQVFTRGAAWVEIP